MAVCIDCGAIIDLSRKRNGQIVECDNCGAEWQVIGKGKAKDIDFPSLEDDGKIQEDDELDYGTSVGGIDDEIFEENI